MAQESRYSHNLDVLERKLNKDLRSILKQEEVLWKQKSRVNWISQGDVNTQFFHLSTIIRRHINNINKLLVNGNWVEDHDTLKIHINTYFNNLFTEDNTVSVGSFLFPAPHP